MAKSRQHLLKLPNSPAAEGGKAGRVSPQSLGQHADGVEPREPAAALDSGNLLPAHPAEDRMHLLPNPPLRAEPQQLIAYAANPKFPRNHARKLGSLK